MAQKLAANGTGENFSLQIVRQALHELAKDGFRENFLTSPLSISFFLNLFAAGTKGQVLERFLTVLEANTLDELHERSTKLKALATCSEGRSDYGEPIVSTANGFWVNHICTVKDSFREILSRVYQIEPKPLDFVNKSEESAEEINSWVSEKTRGLIKKICYSGELEMGKLILLVNTLYFKAAWENQFEESSTKDKPFHLLNGETVHVPFLINSSVHRDYASLDGFKLLKLPYECSSKDNKHFYMYFLLPDEMDGLRKLIHRFDSDPEFLNQDFPFYNVRIGELMIPKFKFAYKFVVSDVMEQMEFQFPPLHETVIIEPLHDYRRRRPLLVVQRAFIAVDEKGTEAAAETDCGDLGCSMDYVPPPALVDFIADHPFLFMIREENSKVPFFIGAVVNPQHEEVLDD